jgi:hypothetical protein
MLPTIPAPTPAPVTPTEPSITVQGKARLERSLLLDGVLPEKVPQGGSMRVTAVLPNGRVEPLVWLHGYDDRYRHPFLLRRPILLPEGTTIQGVGAEGAIGLLAR